MLLTPIVTLFAPYVHVVNAHNFMQRWQQTHNHKGSEADPQHVPKTTLYAHDEY